MLAKPENSVVVSSLYSRFKSKLKPFVQKRLKTIAEHYTDANGKKQVRAVIKEVEEERQTKISFIHQHTSVERVKKSFELVPESEHDIIADLIDKDNFSIASLELCHVNLEGFRMFCKSGGSVQGWENAKEIITPTLATLKLYRGANKCQFILYQMLLVFCTKFGSKRNDISHNENLRDNLLQRFALVLMKNYYYFTLSDVQNVLDNATKSGRKNRIITIDFQTLEEIFKTAELDRLEWAENYSQNAHNSIYQSQYREPEKKREFIPHDEFAINHLLNKK